MKHLLVLAGTGEARNLLKQLAQQQTFRITASLAGATTAPLPLGVTTRSGGFGGVSGLADWVRAHDVDIMLDMTHPYAAQMSAHAATVAEDLALPTLAFHRPPWRPQAGDRWQDFESWQHMSAALPAAARLFLAAGSRALRPFCARPDLTLLIRGLAIDESVKNKNISILASLPNKLVEDEMRLLRDYDISHLACKNSGGEFSRAKLDAARQLGLPVWMLARPALPAAANYYQVFSDVDAITRALLR
jgi:precorrin-6A/cobalt-precorrin-6A reductase